MRYLLVAAVLVVALGTPALLAQEPPTPGVSAPEVSLVLPDVTASALPAQGNAPNGPLGPPPDQPSNACEAHCVADFFECQQVCSRVFCIVSCETLFDLCVEGCRGPI